MGVEVRHEALPEGGFKLRLFEGDAPVGRLVVHRYTMQLAGAGVTMGGIGDVVTHPAHRGKGYGAQLLRGAVDRMREERYHFSILFGIADFYHRFGYAPVLPEYGVTVAVRHGERLPAGASPGAPPGASPSASLGTATVRAGQSEDAPALLELYTRTNAGRNGTLQRAAEKLDPTPPPDAEHWWTHPRRILVAEAAGRPAGYAVLSGNPAHLRVLEVVVPAEHVATAGVALMAALVREAVERRLEQVRLPLPPDEPLVALLRQVGCKVEVSYPANGEGMGRVVVLEALAQALQPALAARVAGLPAGARPGALELTCVVQDGEPEQRARVPLGGGADHVVRLALPQPPLCQLVMGYQAIDALRWRWPEACAEQDEPALRALFPPCYPHMWSLDHF